MNLPIVLQGQASLLEGEILTTVKRAPWLPKPLPLVGLVKLSDI
jgi:hypothetical protein